MNVNEPLRLLVYVIVFIVLVIVVLKLLAYL